MLRMQRFEGERSEGCMIGGDSEMRERFTGGELDVRDRKLIRGSDRIKKQRRKMG